MLTYFFFLKSYCLGVNFWWLLIHLLSHNNEEDSVCWLWADPIWQQIRKRDWARPGYLLLVFPSIVSHAGIIPKWKSILTLAMILETTATWVALKCAWLSLPACCLLAQQPYQWEQEEVLKPPVASSSQGTHLPSTILFLVLWPQGNFTLTIFTGRISLSGFGSCMTKPVYPCCQRTCTDPEAAP